MAAARCNYLVVFSNSPQVFSSSTLETILKSDPPKNCDIEDRTILFTTYFPDEEVLKVFEVTQEEMDEAQAKIDEKLAKELEDATS